MNINNFEQNIEDKIVTRGKNYFTSGYVTNIWYEGQNHYHAVVDGSIPYDVEIRLDVNNEIIGHSCDCPYDWSEYCKHRVAVLFAIRENMAQGTPIKQGGQKGGLRSLLLKQNKEYLVNLLCKLTIEHGLYEDIVCYLEDDHDN